jgi:hypothetical protein
MWQGLRAAPLRCEDGRTRARMAGLECRGCCLDDSVLECRLLARQWQGTRSALVVQWLAEMLLLTEMLLLAEMLLLMEMLLLA